MFFGGISCSYGYWWFLVEKYGDHLHNVGYMGPYWLWLSGYPLRTGIAPLDIGFGKRFDHQNLGFKYHYKKWCLTEVSSGWWWFKDMGK